MEEKKSMSRKLSKAERETLVKEARTRLDLAWQHDRDNRYDAASDLKFLAGDQWPENVRRERELAQRPMLTINRLPQFVRQITNDIRQADITIKVIPEDGNTDKQLAKVYDGLLRQIQYQSSARHVYSTAAEHAAGCGIGWIRITTAYMDDTAFEQEVRIKSIRNPLSVYCDPAAVEPDRADASWIIVTEMMPKTTFAERYPKAAVSEVDAPSDNQESTLFWGAHDVIRVAEYWRKIPVEKEIALMPDGSSIDLTDIDETMRGYLPPPVRTRKVQSHRVEMIVVSGSEVLDGPFDWPGTRIPIVPVIGGEWPLEAKTYRYSAIRFARDPQQLYNFYRTATAEAIALQPKAPYIATPKMLAKFKGMWDSANRNQNPYLLYEPDADAPGAKPEREAPPAYPTALANEAQIASEDMKGTTGIYDAALGAKSNETAGVAIRARQVEGDTANFHFVDNLQRSLEYAGRVLIEIIPKIYDTERVMRLMGESDNDPDQYVTINQVVMGVDGMPVMLNDLSAGRFDLRVKIGKAYQTRRAEAADSLLAFVQAVPQAGQVAADLIAENFDFPGADKLAKRLRNMVPPEMLADPDDPNAPVPQPDPVQQRMAELEMLFKQSQTAKNSADAEAKRADTALKMLQVGMGPDQIAQLFPIPFADTQPMGGEPPMPPPGEMPMLPSGAPDIDPAVLQGLEPEFASPETDTAPAFGP